MDPKKVKGVADWTMPQTVTEVCQFLGFTGYYWYFVPQYSKVACPLLDLTKKTTPWHWGKAQQQAFARIPPSKHLKHDDILNIICQASKWDLTTSGNAAYMQLELALAHVANEKTQLEGLKQSLEEEVIRLQSRLQTIEPCSCAVSHRPFLPLASHFGSHAMLHFLLIHSNWCLSTTHNSQSDPSPQARILTSASRN